MARLEEICSLITDGSHFSPEDEGVGYPMFSVKDMTPNGFNISGCKKIGEEAYKKLVTNGCKPLNDDVVVAKDGSYLKTAFVIKGNPEIALLSSIAILRPKIDLVVPEYLSYFLKSDAVYRTVSLNYITGTALKRIILKGIRKIEVDLPDIGEQEQRAQRLSKVDYLCQLRKQQLAKLDELVKARFVEMFGDPDQNPKGWPLVSVTEIIRDKASNGFFAKRDAYKDDGNVQILGVSNVVNRMYSNTKELPRTNATQAEKEKYSVKYGDMLFCRSSLVADGIGKASIVAKGTFPNVLFECHVIRLSLDLQKCVPEFVQVLSTTPFFRRQIIAQSKTATMTTIGQDGILKSSVVLPPIDLQNQFAAFVERVDQQKQTVQQSLEKLELMKKALMQEYFG